MKNKKIQKTIVTKPIYKFDSKKVSEKGIGFEDLPKQLQIYILKFLASSTYQPILSLVSRSWYENLQEKEVFFYMNKGIG